MRCFLLKFFCLCGFLLTFLTRVNETAGLLRKPAKRSTPRRQRVKILPAQNFHTFSPLETTFILWQVLECYAIEWEATNFLAQVFDRSRDAPALDFYYSG